METVGVASEAIAGLVAFAVSLVAQLAVTRRLRPGVALVTGLGVSVTLTLVGALRYRRATRASARSLLRAPSGRWRFARPPQPMPALSELRRVVAVGQTEVRGGTSVTLFSLEVYGDGFQASLLVARRADPASGRRSTGVPEMVLEVADSAGRRYDAWPAGGGSHGAWAFRFAYRFAPALDPSATELRLRVTAIHWHGIGEDEPPLLEVEPGPWTFTVPL